MPPAIPLATYRVQLTAAFGFDAAATIVPYLKELGITHLYASPFMKARKGSTHGYDIVDHTLLNPELGGASGFARLSEALRAHDLGLILDFVPNHMGVHFADNPWWLDILEWGPASPHAETFDIDWDMLPFRPRGGVLLPILGVAYGTALENGDIALRYAPEDGSFSAWYFEHRLPILPRRYGDILRAIVHETGTEDNGTGAALLRLAATAQDATTRERAAALKRALAATPGAAQLIADGLAAYRAAPDRPAAILALHRLLERQYYRLAHWRLAASDINYRRFFDVNTLAGLRVENAPTFEAIHGLVHRLLHEGRLHGIRIDHIDGLRDPAQYLRRLKRLMREALPVGASSPFLVIEKILAANEDLPRFAGVHGTTGYEWLNAIAHVLADDDGLTQLDDIWRQASNVAPDFAPVVAAAKRRVLTTMLTSEFTVLCRHLARIAAGHYSTRDYSADSLRQVLELYVLHFPVYRTYITAGGPTPADRALISRAIEQARRAWFGADDGIFDFLHEALTLDLVRPRRRTHSRTKVRRFALKLQQFTGPVMAKALEDTAFYRYHRLIAFNEVGGDPAADALSVSAFHDLNRARAAQWPHGLTTTATHDTKRGEDARMRCLALTEIPGEWSAAVARWKLLNAPHITVDGAMRSPSPAFEYMLYQALLGAWPHDGIDGTFVERARAFAVKAAREGKQETSWLNPDARYEAGIVRFVENILDHTRAGDFLASFQALAARVALLGALNSLSQITLKATLPGVPDFYQGTELWDLSFVDPDNRRPVDFAARAVLAATTTLHWQELATDWRDGRIKLAWTRHLLRLRAEYAGVFTHGAYRPLEVEGRHRDHVIAFARQRGRDAVIVVVARRFAPFTGDGREWPRADAFDAAVRTPGYMLRGTASHHSRLSLAQAFSFAPVAVLPASRPSGR